jgi:hypothetical protein
VLAGRFHIQIAGVDRIALEDHVGAAIAVKSVGVIGLSLARIVNTADVVDRVAANLAVLGLIVAGGADSLKSNGIDADIVIVVNDVVADGEIRHIPIDI